MPAKPVPDSDDVVSGARKRPRKAASDSAQPADLSVEGRLQTIAADVEWLRDSVEVMNEDMVQSISDLSKAISIVQVGDDKQSTATLRQVLIAVNTMTERVGLMVEAYSTFSTILAAQDAISRKRSRAMLAGMEKVATKFLLAERSESSSKPMPEWQRYSLWLGGACLCLLALVGFLALVGVWS